MGTRLKGLPPLLIVVCAGCARGRVDPASAAPEASTVRSGGSGEDGLGDAAASTVLSGGSSGDGLGDAAAGPPSDGLPPSGPKCSASPTTIVSPFWMQPDAWVEQVGDVAISDTDLFFTLFVPSSLWRVPIRGGAPTKVTDITGNEDFIAMTPEAVIIAADHFDSDANQLGELVRVPLSGGTSTRIADAKGRPRSLVTDGADVYFSDDEGTKGVAAAGGSVRTLASQTGNLAVIGSNVIIADYAGGSVFRVPTNGGAVTTLATNQPGAAYPAACGRDICWITGQACVGVPEGGVCLAGQPGLGAIKRLQSNGNLQTVVEDPSLYFPSGLAFDGTDFFAIRSQDASFAGEVIRVPAAGGTPVPVASSNSIAFDESCLYGADWLRGVHSQAKSYTPSP